MATMPKRVKYRKCQRCGWQLKRNAHSGNRVNFGEFGLQSLEAAWVSARQIEAGRMAASQYLMRGGKVYVRIFPHKPVSTKPWKYAWAAAKGETDYWAAVVRPGTMMYEIAGVSKDLAKQALQRVAHKMPVRCRLGRTETCVEGRRPMRPRKRRTECPSEIERGGNGQVDGTRRVADDE